VVQQLQGIRARSLTVNRDGQTVHIVNIGVPDGHPLADNSEPMGPAGLRHIQINGLPVRAPQFMFLEDNELHRAMSI
jgi:hypothetical protein